MSATKKDMAFPSFSKEDITEMFKFENRPFHFEKIFYDALSAPQPIVNKEPSIEADVRDFLQDRFGHKYKRYQGYWMHEEDLVALAEHYFNLGLMGKQLNENIESKKV